MAEGIRVKVRDGTKHIYVPSHLKPFERVLKKEVRARRTVRNLELI